MAEREIPGEGGPGADEDDTDELEVIDAQAPTEDSSLPEDPELDPEGRPREP